MTLLQVMERPVLVEYLRSNETVHVSGLYRVYSVDILSVLEIVTFSSPQSVVIAAPFTSMDIGCCSVGVWRGWAVVHGEYSSL